MAISYNLYFETDTQCLILAPSDTLLHEVIGVFDPTTVTERTWIDIYIYSVRATMLYVSGVELPLPSNIQLLPESNRGKIFVNVYPFHPHAFYAGNVSGPQAEITFSQMWQDDIVTKLQYKNIADDLNNIVGRLNIFCNKYKDKLTLVVNPDDHTLRFEIDEVGQRTIGAVVTTTTRQIKVLNGAGVTKEDTISNS